MGGRGPGLDSEVAPHALAGTGAAGPGSDPDDPAPRWRTEVLGVAATQLRASLPGDAVVVIGAAPAGVGGPVREGPPGVRANDAVATQPGRNGVPCPRSAAGI